MNDCCNLGGFTSTPNTSETVTSPSEELRFEHNTLMLSPVLANCLIGASSIIFLLMMSLSLAVFIASMKSEDFSWKPRILILRNQLLCDLLLVLTTIPPTLYNLMNKEVVRYGAKCYVLIFTMCAAVICSFMNLAFMAFERYFYICHSIHYISKFTISRTKVGLCAMWLLALTMASMYIGLLTRGQSTSDEVGGFFCEADRLERNLGFPQEAILCRKYSMILWFFSCLLVFVYSYYRMYKLAKDTVQPFQQSNHQAQKTVFFYGLMYTLQVIPLAFKLSLDAFLTSGLISREVFALADMVNQTVVMMIPPCLHPVIYGLRNSEVRLGIQSLFKRSPNNRIGGQPPMIRSCFENSKERRQSREDG